MSSSLHISLSALHICCNANYLALFQRTYLQFELQQITYVPTLWLKIKLWVHDLFKKSGIVIMMVTVIILAYLIWKCLHFKVVHWSCLNKVFDCWSQKNVLIIEKTQNWGIEKDEGLQAHIFHIWFIMQTLNCQVQYCLSTLFSQENVILLNHALNSRSEFAGNSTEPSQLLGFKQLSPN